MRHCWAIAAEISAPPEGVEVDDKGDVSKPKKEGR